MQRIDLFSGIGGFSLVGSWLGWETVAFCEIDPFCQKVLKKHWPDVPIFDDIKTLTANEIKTKTKWDSTEPTIVVGGFPCQPFSTAGKRKGTADDRALWPEMFRVIREVRPTWVVAENVRGLLSVEGGLVFEQVCTDLESEGYEVQPFLIPACAVNAWHRRDRVWIIAYATNSELRRCEQKQGRNGISSEGIREEKDKTSCDNNRYVADPTRSGQLRKKEQEDDGTDRERGWGYDITDQNSPYTDTTSERLRGRFKNETRQQPSVFGQDIQPITPDPEGAECELSGGTRTRWERFTDDNSTHSDTCDTGLQGQQPGQPIRLFGQFGGERGDQKPDWDTHWLEVATEFCGVVNGVSDRVHRLKALGNAIVPQVFYEIAKAIDYIERNKNA
jgi:DNA-cytosine methyltransferase